MIRWPDISRDAGRSRRRSSRPGRRRSTALRRRSPRTCCAGRRSRRSVTPGAGPRCVSAVRLLVRWRRRWGRAPAGTSRSAMTAAPPSRSWCSRARAATNVRPARPVPGPSLACGPQSRVACTCATDLPFRLRPALRPPRASHNLKGRSSAGRNRRGGSRFALRTEGQIVGGTKSEGRIAFCPSD